MDVVPPGLSAYCQSVAGVSVKGKVNTEGGKGTSVKIGKVVGGEICVYFPSTSAAMCAFSPLFLNFGPASPPHLCSTRRYEEGRCDVTQIEGGGSSGHRARCFSLTMSKRLPPPPVWSSH